MAATLTVLITTLDDSVWLLPFVGSSNLSVEARMIHAAVFVGTLEALSIACCLVAIIIRKGFAAAMNEEVLEIRLELVAVIICWGLAGFFFFRKLYRRRKRQLEKEEQSRIRMESKNTSTEVTLESFEQTTATYGTVAQEDIEEHVESEEHWETLPTSAQPWMVVSFTAVGFLDEISYFPALVVGKVFSLWELCIGTLLAGLLMLGIQMFLSQQCKPLIEFLDNRVPLYGIITFFATVLTLNLIWDVWKEN